MMFTLQVVDLGLLLAGGLCLLGFVVWLVRRRRWHNPLAGVALPSGGPTAGEAAAVFLFFFALQLVAISLLGRVFPAEETIQPGSRAWHWVASGGNLAQIVASLVMAIVLTRTRHPSDHLNRIPPARALLAGVVGALVVVPLVAIQAGMATVVWHWLWPSAPPPTHESLEALHETAWGPWGIVHLLAGALVFAPLTEELLFRGVLLQALTRHLRLGWVAIAASAVLFGCMHLGQPQTILPLITMGLVLGYVRLRTGWLWPCILLHSLFNARTMTFALVAPELLSQQ